MQCAVSMRDPFYLAAQMRDAMTVGLDDQMGVGRHSVRLPRCQRIDSLRVRVPAG